MAKPAGGRGRWIKAGFGGLIVLALVVLGAIAISLFLESQEQAHLVPTPLPSPTRQADVNDVMDTLHGDCTACHLTAEGGVGTRPIPPLAHPVKGWTNCTACHAEARLVTTAPGHTGIHADQCLVCHKGETAAAPPRAHPDLKVGARCLDCHGKSAPLPGSMASRDESTCWLCHRPSVVDTPVIPHPITGNEACLSCHVAGEVGALPANHAGRTDSICTECHETVSTTAPVAPHSLAGLEGQCASCHGPGVSPRPLPSDAGPSPGAPTSPGAGATTPP